MKSSKLNVNQTKRCYVLVMLKKQTGIGGKVSSSLQAKPRAIPAKPMAGAVKPRIVTASQFRYFYDRGDLPIAI